ncbi:hypothetical protein LSAT2_026313 [Lamellibrachia satsuma]|nr:hypothetical protein LSAT2_026313 [Lamellibrachia satsuma]
MSYSNQQKVGIFRGADLDFADDVALLGISVDATGKLLQTVEEASNAFVQQSTVAFRVVTSLSHDACTSVLSSRVTDPSSSSQSTVQQRCRTSLTPPRVKQSSFFLRRTDAAVAQPYNDFLQGTGWMEKTIMFYGTYSDKRVYMSTESRSYNLPLAFLITVLAYFLLSFVLVVRQIFVPNVNQVIAQRNGLQEFEFPKTFSHFICIHFLVWLGTFFPPLIPALTALLLCVLFYARMVSSNPYRASDTNYVLIVLMVAYAMCAVIIMYVIGSYDYMYGIVKMTIAERRDWVHELVYYLDSDDFGISCILALMPTIFFTQKMEDHDKKFLVERLREVSGQNETSPVKKRGMGGGYGYGEDSGIPIGFPLIS